MKESKVINKFLNYYANKITRQGYKSALNAFFALINCSPDEYFDADRDYENDIRQFANSMIDRPPKTFYSYMGILHQFLIRNEIDTKPLVWKDLKLIKRGTKALTRDRPPSIDELKLILSHADLKMTSLILTLISSGIRIGELTKISPADIDFDYDPTKIYLWGSITKTGNPRITFISDEASTILQEWIKNHDNYLKTAVKKTNIPGASKNKIDNRVFPFTPTAARSAFNRLLRLTNLNQRDSETGRYIRHIHTFRKYFRSKMALIIPQDITETLIGHQSYLSSSYLRYSEEELAEYYLQGMSTVTVFGDNNKKEIEDLENEIKRRDEKIENIINRMGTLDKKFENIENMAELMKKMKKPNLRL